MIHGPSSTDHPHVAIYRRAADAFRKRDLDALAETIHEDVHWHFPGTSWVSREIAGRDALLAYLRELMTKTDGSFLLEDIAISGNDHHVVAVQRFGATHRGDTQKFEAVSVMRFDDGRQLERWFHLLDIEAFDAFFAKFD
jgi:ketosteroid isomerase-like protein